MSDAYQDLNRKKTPAIDLTLGLSGGATRAAYVRQIGIHSMRGQGMV